MTTVIWDGKQMVADTQSSYHKERVYKIIRDEKTGDVYGFSGALQVCLDEIRHLIDESSPEAIITDPRDLRIMRASVKHGLQMREGLGKTWVNIVEPFFAIGSGSGYAMGAMEIQRRQGRPIDGIEALNIAHKFDDATGPEVTFMVPHDGPA